MAPDSFKGSLTSLQVASIMEKAISRINPKDKVIIKPMADGGEGTVDVLLASTNGRHIPIICTGPLGKEIDTYYGIVDDKTAIIEIANITGLVQVPENKRNPDNTSSNGLGEVIQDALDKECTTIIIGLGGSATNDGGYGLLRSLGMKAWRKDRIELGVFGKDMIEVEKISFADLDPRILNVVIRWRAM